MQSSIKNTGFFNLCTGLITGFPLTRGLALSLDIFKESFATDSDREDASTTKISL